MGSWIDGKTLPGAGRTFACHCGTLRITDLKLRIASLTLRIVGKELVNVGRAPRKSCNSINDK
jgi:hypothetical protein